MVPNLPDFRNLAILFQKLAGYFQNLAVYIQNLVVLLILTARLSLATEGGGIKVRARGAVRGRARQVTDGLPG